MTQHVNYIATWFYRESADEASFYPQMGEKGSSELVHSIYMQIQVPFFVTFHRYNPDARLLFFTNMKAEELPPFLQRMFAQLGVEVVTTSYTCRPPRGWYAAWQNQFYLFDILRTMEPRMHEGDCLLVSDADCLCRASISGLFDEARRNGSALYEFITDRDYVINGITLPQINSFYEACYGEKPQQPITYYGGEFICLNTDAVRSVNAAYPELWSFNLAHARTGQPKLNEEAHVISVLAERLHLRNRTANSYVKRMWTNPRYNNVRKGDENYAVWHLPYEKKRGLYRLYHALRHDFAIHSEDMFWKQAGRNCGIPDIGTKKKLADFCTKLRMKLKIKH